MKKKTKESAEITEKDIQAAIRYLQINNPLHATKEDAIVICKQCKEQHIS